MKTNYNITTPEQFKSMSAEGNGISIWVTNSRDLYCRLEALADCCVKKFKKFGGLDMGYLTESSVMKGITRDARKQLRKWDEVYSMEDDRQARKYLALWVYEYCLAVVE